VSPQGVPSIEKERVGTTMGVRATSIVTAPCDEWWDFSIHDFY